MAGARRTQGFSSWIAGPCAGAPATATAMTTRITWTMNRRRIGSLLEEGADIVQNIVDRRPERRHHAKAAHRIDQVHGRGVVNTVGVGSSARNLAPRDRNAVRLPHHAELLDGSGEPEKRLVEQLRVRA